MTIVLIYAVIYTSTNAQVTYTQTDSIQLASVINDTTQLRQITIQRHGERIAAKAQNRLGAVAYERKTAKDAEGEFKVTYTQYRNTPEAIEAAHNLARIAYGNDQFEPAIKYYKEFLQSNPTGSNAQWAKYCLIRSMRATDDVNFLTVAKEYLQTPHDSSSSRDVIIQYDIVRYLASQGEHKSAIDEARQLIKKYPNSEYVSHVEPRIAECYMLNGDSTSAIEECVSLLNKYPTNTRDAARAQCMLGVFYSNLNNFERARIELKKVKQFHPSVTGWINAADYELAALDFTESNVRNDSTLQVKALEGLKAFIVNHPGDRSIPKAYMNISTICMGAGNYNEALASYDNIINFDSTLIQSGKYANRSDAMKSHCELVVRAQMMKGMLLKIQMNNPSAALAVFESLLVKRPKLYDALLNKAICLAELGQKPAARAILEQLVTDNTNVKETAAQILKSL